MSLLVFYCLISYPIAIAMCEYPWKAGLMSSRYLKWFVGLAPISVPIGAVTSIAGIYYHNR